ncbi:MAG: SpoIIE family protein phosphatase [Bacillota bacterium]|nr:SpoIIE family protein phosphatase [Bacillota bacterium]
MEIMQDLFVKLIGTLAVLIAIAVLVEGNDVVSKLAEGTRSWRSILAVGIMGGVLGIYGNLAGINLHGAVVSIRDIGPMLAGFTGGPVGGLIAGVIAGAHRLFLGGITANACIIATCLIGLICGVLSQKFKKRIIRPGWSFLVGVAMECMHLGIVLLMVKPFETAWDIVRQIALPFVLINAVGFMALTFFISSIEKRKKQNAEKNRLQTELESAAGIQNSLLPPVNENFPGRKELCVSASVDTAKEVGGDFYDVFFTDKDTLAIVVADVSGKGIPAALFMVRSKLTIQNCVRDIPDLAEAVTAANRSLCSNNEMEMFVTAWIGLLDIKSGRIRYVNAGHNDPVLITESGEAFLEDKHGIVLAGIEGFTYRERTVDMKPGDTLFLYTDGVTEAENKEHELFGDDRLLASLDGVCGEDVDAIKEKVEKSIEAHVDGFDQFDDITMMCVRYMGGKDSTLRR